MDKAAYENLKNKNYEEAVFYIMDLLRGSMTTEDSITYVAAASTLAITLDKTNNSSFMKSDLEKSIGDETTLTFLKKVEKEFSNQIDNLSKRFDVETLKAVVLFAEPKLFSESDIGSTPEGISKLAISLLSLEKDDVILDLGSGVGSFLIQAAQESNSENLYGVEINTNNVIISNLRKFIVGLPIKIIQGNIISQNFSHLSANKIFSNYPLGMRLPILKQYIDKNPKIKKYFKEAKRTVSGDWVFGMASCINMHLPGKAVIIMSNAGTWNKPDEEFRKRLVEDGLVEGIILLPSRLLSSTMIPLTMMVLSQNNKEIRMVDATDIYSEGRRQNTLETEDVERIIAAYYNHSSISKNKKINEIADQEYILNPQRYIGIDAGITDGISLGELSQSINRGAMIKSKELDELVSTEETDCQYLMLQNIHDGVIDSDLPNLTSIDGKYERYCINDKNLIVSKLSPFKVAMAHLKDDEKILANGNLYFINLDEDKVNPVFVEVFLRSEIGIAQLNRFAKGTAMKSISIQDLKRIQIPNLPRDKQEQIAEEYENLNDELIVLQRQIDMICDKKANLMEGVI